MCNVTANPPIKRWLAGLVSTLMLLCSGAVMGQQVNPVKQLLVQRSGFDWNTFLSVGSTASADEICSVLSHPLLRRPLPAFRSFNSINFDLRWEGIEAAPLWIEKRFEQAGVAPQRLSLHPDTLRSAEQQLSACLSRKEREQPDLYAVLKGHFLHYLGPDCHKPVYESRKTVDNNGNLSETRIAVGKPSCIDFNYNSGDYSSWNSTSFALMLIWKEAHPVLNTLFNRGDAVLQSLLEEQQRKETLARAESDERRRQTQQRNQEADRKCLGTCLQTMPRHTPPLLRALSPGLISTRHQASSGVKDFRTSSNSAKNPRGQFSQANS